MNKKLHLSNNRIIAGVCSGVAEYFNVDPTLVRIVWVLLTILSSRALMIAIYIILWAIMPQE